MGRPLSELTLEELWQLFPIYLVPPRSEWAERYRDMEAELHTLLCDRSITRISHIGSTAIPGIWAKDIVDVLVEFNDSDELMPAAELLERHGFTVMYSDEEGIGLNRGYTPDGFADRVYHIHLRRAGENAELYFRDYMNAHPELAQAYQALKLDLWRRYEHDRNAYTNAKTGFITRMTQAARREYGDRYAPADRKQGKR